MCLMLVNNKKISHSKGYKIFIVNTDKILNQYRSNNFEYRIGHSYNSYDIEPIHFISSDKGDEYRSGFHYFLRMKDAKKYCYENNTIVVRVLVKTITVTGIDSTTLCKSGVCETIFLEKIMYNKAENNKNKIRKIIKSMINELPRSRELIKILNIKDKNVQLNETDKFLKTIDDIRAFCIIVDCFPRTSDIFKQMSSIWLKLCPNKKDLYYLLLKDYKTNHIYKKYSYEIYSSYSNLILTM